MAILLMAAAPNPASPISLPAQPPDQPRPSPRRGIALCLTGLLLLVVGLLWLIATRPADALPPPDPGQLVSAPQLTPGVVAAMTSPAIAYGPGWRVSAAGADPAEPVDPWQEPAGALTFTYQGRALDLALAEGDYWSYLYVTVDGAPANRLSNIRGNVNHQGLPAGYKTLLAPELVAEADGRASAVRWQPIHRAADDGPHTVRIEVWRGWGQTPLRALAVDGLPPPARPRWPGIASVAAGGWLLAIGLIYLPPRRRTAGDARRRWARLPHAARLQPLALGGAVGGLGLVVAGSLISIWWLCLCGLTLLGLAALVRPIIWPAALLFALPFYYSVKLPLLPQRAFELTDAGVAGGLLLLVYVLLISRFKSDVRLNAGYRYRGWTFSLLLALVTWALVSATAADYTAPALREWRTVFLTAALFALTLIGLLRYSRQAAEDRRILIGAWSAGATLMAIIALGQYLGDFMLIAAEGVRRVRGLYGSPNNLALYLERSLAVALALGLFGRGRLRFAWLIAAGLQAAALLLTFSKGALFLALPVMLLTLWGGGFWLLGQRGEGRRVLWWLAGIGALAGLALLPFLGTERFQRLLDFRSGTGFLRIQLWRSASQMALDHPLLGVGPDNFLYSFRNRYLLPAAWQEPNLNHPHNWLLDWWTRLGLPGLVLGAGYWLSGTRDLLRNFARSNLAPNDQALALGLMAAVAAGLAHGLIDISYALPDLMLVWVLIFFVLPRPVNN